jgi:putative ABC transport system permease protein
LTCPPRALADLEDVSLRVGAVYERAAGMGDVLLDPATAREHAAVQIDASVFVSGGAAALDRYAGEHPGVHVLSRDEYLDTLHAGNDQDLWGIWLIIMLAAVFSALALVNTAAMSTGERRAELATIRLLGGTSGHVTRMVLLEMVPTVATALGAGAVIVGVALTGVPQGLTGEPLSAPVTLIAGLLGGTLALGLLAGVVTARIALRPTSGKVTL